MTYDDIRNMAFEAGLEVHRGVEVLLVRHPDGRWVDAKDELMAFANIAFAKGAAEEREACIKLLEDFSKTQMVPVKDTWRMGLIAGANAIRARRKE